DRIARCIPLGQPILVGHHSERRHRRDVERIHSNMGKGLALVREAEALERRAAVAEENQAISSDDPDAVSKLRAEIATEEAFSARWKAINKAARKGVEALKALDLTADELRTLRFAPCGTGFMVTNTATRIRRLKQRITELESKAARPVEEPVSFGEITVSRDVDDNRVRIAFPGKPAGSVIAELKRNGFRWSPTAGAWQRQDTESAWYHAKRIAEAAAGGA
ncbi:MAG TPA: DUF3560 domain-containing protein, partial [Polyangiaceae bacterium]